MRNMKWRSRIQLACVVLIVLAFAFCFGNICDDDESGPGLVCRPALRPVSEQLLLAVLSSVPVRVVSEADFFPQESIADYLQLHQKSPPPAPVSAVA